MIIDNSENAAKYNMAYIILLSMSFILAAYALIVDLPKQHYTNLALAGLIFCGYLSINLLRLFFVQVEDTQVKIILRYYFLHPLLRKPRMFEFPKPELTKFEIRKLWGGLRKELVVYQKSAKGLVKYPAVSLSAFSKKEIEILEKQLTHIIMQNSVRR
jgi:hypothetical protein